MLCGQGQRSNGVEVSSGTSSVSTMEGMEINEKPQSNFNVVDIGLSNILVLREIFKHLIYEDLVSCCKVNSIWRAVADPMICYYRITFDSRSRRDDNELNVEVVEINGFTSIAQTSRMEFEDLMNKLRNSKKKHLMSIELRLCGILTKYYLPLLTEFGHRVHVFDCESRESRFHIVSFFSNIYYFKNLQVLKCNGVHLKCTHFPEHELVLPQLRRIYMGKTVPIQYWPELLKLAPNVQELLEFPVKLMIFNQHTKVEAIKSLVYSRQFQNFSLSFINKSDLRQIDVSLQILAERGPELSLKSAAIPNFYYLFPPKQWDRSKEEVASIQANFKRVLEFSKDTVTSMTIPAAKGLYYFLPINFQMMSVKTLKFEDDSVLDDDKDPYIFKNDSHYNIMSVTNWTKKHHYCPKGTNLLTMFPNIQALEIKFNLSRRRLNEFFPSDTFGPKMLGTCIKSLKIKVVSPDGFKKLIRLFPSVIHLEMESTVEHFSTVFPTICKAWVELESLKIFFNPSKSFHRHGKCEHFSLDPIITGIPEEVCKEMNDHGIFTGQEFSDKINKFQSERISFLHLRNLQLLEFIITGKNFICDCSQKHEPNFISNLSASFGFQKLPHLTVYVRMIKGLGAFDELKHALSPLMNWIELDNTYTVPREYD